MLWLFVYFKLLLQLLSDFLVFFRKFTTPIVRIQYLIKSFVLVLTNIQLKLN